MDFIGIDANACIGVISCSEFNSFPIKSGTKIIRIGKLNSEQYVQRAPPTAETDDDLGHFDKLSAQDSTGAVSKIIISTPCCPYINDSFV